MPVKPALLDTIDKAAKKPPADYVQQQGWVLIAFQNALYQLLHAPSLEESADDTIMCGGDTDPMRPFAGHSWARCTGWTPYPPNGSTRS